MVNVRSHMQEDLQAVYRYAPFVADNDTWLTELLSRPEPGQELASVLRGRDTPNIPHSPEAKEDWLRFLANCKCDSDDQPDKGCHVHALIEACARLSQDTRVLAICQLTTPEEQMPNRRPVIPEDQ